MAYDIRVQIANDGSFSYGDFKRALAHFAQSRRGVVTVWVDGDRWDEEYHTLDPDWDMSEGDIRGTYAD